MGGGFFQYYVYGCFVLGQGNGERFIGIADGGKGNAEISVGKIVKSKGSVRVGNGFFMQFRNGYRYSFNRFLVRVGYSADKFVLPESEYRKPYQ